MPFASALTFKEDGVSTQVTFHVFGGLLWTFALLSLNLLSMDLSGAQDTSILNKERHIKYWLRCLRTYLPGAHYTSSDSNRVLLAFFIVSALDLLGALYTNTSEAERADYIDWVYRCQHAEGGFRGFTGTDLRAARSEENSHWDPANLPATYFALVTLVILGDDLSRVRRRKCLEWLPKLQRPDGSFGETLGEGAAIEGGRDMRFCNCAAGVRCILRGRGVDLDQDVVDVNVDKMVRYIRASEVCAVHPRPKLTGICREFLTDCIDA